MGSWNDLVFAGPDEAAYDELSNRLYRAMMDAFCASVNSPLLP